MIIADTNVLSEPLRRTPDARVLTWLAEHAADLAVTTISVAELVYGARRLPDGRRRTLLIRAVDEIILDATDRLLAYDETAARWTASLRIARDAVGRPTSTEDVMIAAIAAAHGACVATRNVADFDGFGVEVVDPWNP